MKKQTSIPLEAKSFLEELLWGKSKGPLGLCTLAKNIDEFIPLAKAKIADKDTPEFMKTWLVSSLAPLALPKTRKDVQRRINQINRLKDYKYMGEAYSILTKEFTDPRQWQSFIIAALRADYYFERHRKNIERGEKISKDIAKYATKLAGLLEEFQSLSLDKIPPQFVSTRYLLASTQIWGMLAGKSDEWLKHRSTIVGDLKYDDGFPASKTGSPYSLSVMDLFTDDSERFLRPVYEMFSQIDESQDALEFAWSMAPKPSEVLVNLATTASKYEARQIDMVGAAIKRTRCQKTEYIRGLGYALTENYGIELNSNIIKVIALTTKVVLYDKALDGVLDPKLEEKREKKLDASEEDAKKALPNSK